MPRKINKGVSHKKRALKFFNDRDATLSYIGSELVATLQDDLRENPDETDLKQKIHDIEHTMPQVDTAFAILKEWVEDVDALFDGESHLNAFWPDMYITYTKAKALMQKGATT